MKCRDVQRALPEYLDGTLDGTLRGQLREHVDGCPACAAVAADFEAIVRGAQHLPFQRPEEAYWSSLLPRVHARIESRAKFLSTAGLVRNLSPIAVSCAVLLFLLSMPVSHEAVVPGLLSTLQNAPPGELQLMADQEIVLRDDDQNAPAEDQDLSASGDVEPIQDILGGDQPAFSSIDDVSSSVLEGMDDQQLHALVASVDVPEMPK